MSSIGIVRERSGLHSAHWWNTEVEYSKVLSWLIVAKKYKKALEVGTFMGATTEVLKNALSITNGHLITVDQSPVYIANSELVSQFIMSSSNFFSIHDGTFDFAYIDGGHDFATALSDMTNAWRRLDNGGAIAVHDIGDDGIQDVKVALKHFKQDFGGQWSTFTQGKGLAIGEF